MKKVASLVAAALITCSLGACGNRNTAYNRDINPGPINTRNNANAPNIGGNVGLTTNYRDGVYLGTGSDRGKSGNEAAIVTIRGGRITDVVLKSIDAQGRDVTHYSGTTGNYGNNVNTSNVNNVNTTTGNSMSRVTDPGMNTQTGGNTNRVTGSTVNGPMGGAGTTGTGVSDKTGLGVNPNGSFRDNTSYNNINNNNLGNNNILNNNNNAAATNISALESSRKELTDAIIRAQSANVTVSSNQTGAVDNWKLAVSRALESARR